MSGDESHAAGDGRASEQREALERQLLQARARLTDAVANSEATRAAGESDRRMRGDQLDEEDRKRATTLQAEDLFGFGPMTVPHEASRSVDSLPMEPSFANAIDDADRQVAEARAEVARLEQAIGDLPPTEDILADLGPEAVRAAVGVAVGGGGPPSGEEGADAARISRRVLAALALSGSALALLILAWTWLEQQRAGSGLPSPSVPAVAATAPPDPSPIRSQPNATPRPPAPGLTPARTVAPTRVPATPSPTAALPTPVPLAQRPATGESLAIGQFSRTAGSCPIADTFSAAFHLAALDEAATLTQLPEEHVTTGTLTRSGPSSGLLFTSAQGQVYNATVSGNTAIGTHEYSVGVCNDTYDLRLLFDQPLLAPPPLGNAPAFFQFFDTDGPVLEMPVDKPLRVGLGSYGDPVIADLLPVRVELQLADDTPWSVTLQPGGGDDTLCPEPISCSAPAPTQFRAEWLAPPAQPVLIAYGSGGDVLAVWAPNDLDWSRDWLAELVSVE